MTPLDFALAYGILYALWLYGFCKTIQAKSRVVILYLVSFPLLMVCGRLALEPYITQILKE